MRYSYAFPVVWIAFGLITAVASAFVVLPTVGGRASTTLSMTKICPETPLTARPNHEIALVACG